MNSILYLTDLYYPAKGRNYYEEDMFIVSRLMDDFDVAICHPKNAESFEDNADLIVFRNCGPVIEFKDVYDRFVKRVHEKGLKTFNEFAGRGDMSGKQYLIDLTKSGYSVIPTVDDINEFGMLPENDSYVIKPKIGADSIGMEILTREELLKKNITGNDMLIEPEVDFKYEVSFYFINDEYEYAMYAPDKKKRWELKEYKATKKDLEFARKFIEWNDIKHGIQRVDACRTQEGRLLLVELEDLNPYLSLQLTSKETQKKFLNDFKNAILDVLL